MLAALLIFVLAFFLGGIFWQVFGSLINLSEDRASNEVINLAIYCAIFLPISFVVVFFLLERL